MERSPKRPSILSVFSSFAVGGPQIRFTKLAAHLGDRFQHAVIAMDGDYSCRSRVDPALDVTYPEISFAKGRTVANVVRFRKRLRELRPDILVTNNWGSIEWSVANAIPITRHIHIEDGFGPEERDVQLSRRIWARRVFLRRSTVVVPSLTLQRIATDKWRLPSECVKYIPNGIDCARFAQRTGRMSWPGDGPVVGTVAALRPEKNLPRLLHAFRLAAQRLPARLVIVGDGPELASLQQLSVELELEDRVYFVGATATPEAYYPGFDIFALSSDTEQMPLSVLEAMAAGLPIVATNVGDVASMVAAENDRFVFGREASLLAQNLQTLVSDPDLRRRLGEANQVKAFQCYSEAEMHKAYSRLLEAPVWTRLVAGLMRDCDVRTGPVRNA
jgi:glycosyltransferase involved in cell wall biosynthesis